MHARLSLLHAARLPAHEATNGTRASEARGARASRSGWEGPQYGVNGVGSSRNEAWKISIRIWLFFAAHVPSEGRQTGGNISIRQAKDGMTRGRKVSPMDAAELDCKSRAGRSPGPGPVASRFASSLRLSFSRSQRRRDDQPLSQPLPFIMPSRPECGLRRRGARASHPHRAPRPSLRVRPATVRFGFVDCVAVKAGRL